MNFNPYEELRQYLLSRREYSQQTLIKLIEFKNTLGARCALPKTTTTAGLDNNHLMCMSTLNELEMLVTHLCAMPLTPDTNMATYDLHNRLFRWTEIYKLNVEDTINFELNLLNGVI